jgi:hypothetical protein
MIRFSQLTIRKNEIMINVPFTNLKVEKEREREREREREGERKQRSPCCLVIAEKYKGGEYIELSYFLLTESTFEAHISNLESHF